MLFINKPSGETPLQTLTQWQRVHPEFKNQTLSYAGRLDPMAEGLLMILVGEENKQRRSYEKLPKVYQFEIIPGISTDTGDVMGLITSQTTNPVYLSEGEFERTISTLIGPLSLPYPDFSAKYVNGHPLYWYARRNLLHTIDRPRQTVQINSLTHSATELVSTTTMLTSITRRLNTVEGDFRQLEICNNWQGILGQSQDSYQLLRCELHCSSGTYVRGIVTYLSQLLNQPLLTYTIRRTDIGSHTIKAVGYR